MAAPEFDDFAAFWPHYLREHANPWTRRLHFVGTTAAIGCVGYAVVARKRWPLALALVAGYGPAWVSHFFVEKNRPASFRHPLWSLRADLVMWWKTIDGTLGAELAEALGNAPGAEASASAAAEPSEGSAGAERVASGAPLPSTNVRPTGGAVH